MTRQRPRWDDYVESFHARRPGITEDVLVRCTDLSGTTPYEWLVERLDPTAKVLDLACGSAPMRHLLANHWTGVDRSATELQRAATTERSGLVRGDVRRLPIRSGTVDVAICSMALMLLEPLAAVLTEVHRVLADGGQIRVLVPTTRPMTLPDRWAYARLSAIARSTPHFPPTSLGDAQRAFTAAGFEIRSDEAQRFVYLLHEPAGATTFIESWYTPRRQLGDAQCRDAHLRAMPSHVGVPLRRIIARRS